jgi:hypothetical protein
VTIDETTRLIPDLRLRGSQRLLPGDDAFPLLDDWIGAGTEGLPMIPIALAGKQMTLGHWVFDVRDFPPARIPDLPSMQGSIPALLATPS